MPIVGLDGVMGLPGYAGALPNPMLAHSLILGRELLLSGSASMAFTDPSADFEGLQAKAGKEDFHFFRLQPGVRSALIGMELFDGLKVTGKFGDKEAKVAFVTGETLVTLTRPDSATLLAQLKLVQSFSDLRSERTSEILSQVVPQSAAWSAIAGLSAESHRYTFELLGAGLRFATSVAQAMKWILGVPRPVEVNPTIQPMILTPGFSAYPMGHATEAYFAAEFLYLLKSLTPSSVAAAAKAASAAAGGVVMPDADPPVENLGEAEMKRFGKQSMRMQLLRLAYRVSENRVVSGVHYPVDSLPGQLLGLVLARYFVAAASGMVRVPNGAQLLPFYDKANPGKLDQLALDCQPTLDQPLVHAMALEYKNTKQPASSNHPLLALLWARSLKEWEAN